MKGKLNECFLAVFSINKFLESNNIIAHHDNSTCDGDRCNGEERGSIEVLEVIYRINCITRMSDAFKVNCHLFLPLFFYHHNPPGTTRKRS